MPTINYSTDGIDIAAMVAVGHAQSKSEARRLIKQGAVRIGKIRVSDPFARFFITNEGRSFVVRERA